MKRFLVFLCATFLVFGATGIAGAVTLDFNDYNNLGVHLVWDVAWSSQGGGHLYCEKWDVDGYIIFHDTTYVNSFEMNGLPWVGYSFPTTIDLINIEAFDSGNQSVWSETIDLSNYTSWDNWLTVSVETADVARIAFYATGTLPDDRGFWPSIDNLVITEADGFNPIPEPATMLLLASGLVGLAGFRRKLKK